MLAFNYFSFISIHSAACMSRWSATAVLLHVDVLLTVPPTGMREKGDLRWFLSGALFPRREGERVAVGRRGSCSRMAYLHAPPVMKAQRGIAN